MRLRWRQPASTNYQTFQSVSADASYTARQDCYAFGNEGLQISLMRG